MRLRRRAVRRGTHPPRPRRDRAPAHAAQLPPSLGCRHGRRPQDLRRLCQDVCLRVASSSISSCCCLFLHGTMTCMNTHTRTVQKQALCADSRRPARRAQHARAALPRRHRLCARHLRRGVGRVLPPAAPPRRRAVHAGPLPLPRVVLPHRRAPRRGTARPAAAPPPPALTAAPATAAHAAVHAPAAPAQSARRADPRHTHPRRLLTFLCIARCRVCVSCFRIQNTPLPLP